jgi:hypothetical protein
MQRLVVARSIWCGAALTACILPFGVSAQEATDEEQLAKNLSNPVAAMISVPFQSNWDHEFGPERDGNKFYMNIQPVIPARISADWNLISRIIVPLIAQRIPSVGDGSQSGVGDITGEFFFSPTTPDASGIIWGIGPAVIVPTKTDYLSADRWALGPTAVVLKQDSGWTYGALVNHLWSVGGGGQQDINNTFFQPFIAYTTKDAWTFNLDAESSYDWTNQQWTVPFNATVSKLFRVGKQPISMGVAARYYADSPSNGPHGWSARFTVTLLFPQ